MGNFKTDGDIHIQLTFVFLKFQLIVVFIIIRRCFQITAIDPIDYIFCK